MGKALVSLVTLLCIIPVAAQGEVSTQGTARSGRVIHYVSLGDSVTGTSPSFVDIVAKQAGVALHGKATVTKIFEEGTVAALAGKIKSTPAFRNAIRAADLITITIGVNQVAQAANYMTPNGCGSRDGSACVRKAEKAFERSYGALLNQLTKLRSPSKVAYRLLTAYDLPGVFRAAKGVAFTAALRAENRFVRAQASRHRMKCVDVYAAFNGANGSRDPLASGLTLPDRHPSVKGSATIAKLVVATGFAPLR